MHILFCLWGSILEPGITDAFNRLGYDVISFNNPPTDNNLDKEYIDRLANSLMNTPDIELVFSVNYIPIISKTCNILKKHYISWTVDSPSLTLYSKSMQSPYSHAFIFDYMLYSKFAQYFPHNVHYMPLAGNSDYCDAITISDEDYGNYICDISFVGSFHTAHCLNFDTAVPLLPDYMRGYIHALIQAQLNVYGYYLIEDSISRNLADSIIRYSNFTTFPDYIYDVPGIVSDHIIGFKCNQQDRLRTLKHLANYYDIDLYTDEDTSSTIPRINNHGISDTSTTTPVIYKCSKINLNITARTIKSGIPQRIFDIMAAGGFVISNYQPEIPEYFTPDEDIVLYNSLEELTQKIRYYLNNETERLRIANNGYRKVKEEYNFSNRLKKMIDIINTNMHH